MLLANDSVPRDTEANGHLLAALRDLEIEGVETRRPATTLQAIRSAIQIVNTHAVFLECSEGQDSTMPSQIS